MKTGTKSLLFGVHQFIWHPITVFLAWNNLYGMPSLKETMCIIVHDFGYFGKPNMDGEEGKSHPELGAKIMEKHGEEYRKLCLYHSRSYAKKDGSVPSKLCWADKMSIKYETWWSYLPRAILSGELKEYKECGAVREDISHRQWFERIQKILVNEAVIASGNSEYTGNEKHNVQSGAKVQDNMT